MVFPGLPVGLHCLGLTVGRPTTRLPHDERDDGRGASTPRLYLIPTPATGKLAHIRAKKWAAGVKAIKQDQPLDALSDRYSEFSEFVLGVLSYWFVDCLIKKIPGKCPLISSPNHHPPTSII